MSNYNKTYSPKEYAKHKNDERNKAFALVDETMKQVVDNVGEFKQYLDVQSRLDKYSAINGLLIYAQCPQATEFKDYKSWSKDGVKINKGEKSVMIIEPSEYIDKYGKQSVSYNVKKVFDISQTNAERKSKLRVNREPCDNARILLDSCPFKYEIADELPNSDIGAFFDQGSKRLLIKRAVGDSNVLFQSIARELAHAELATNSETYDRTQSSFSANCVSYMLCRKYGVDVNSIDINQLPKRWSEIAPKELRKELSSMKKCFSNIQNRIYRTLKQEKQEQKLSQER